MSISGVTRYRLLRGLVLCFYTVAAVPAFSQSMMLSTDNSDYEVTNVFSDVDFFTLDIEIDAPLAPGVYMNPDIVSVTYQVQGELEPGTPSGFPAFFLQRSMTGAEFYEQGSSLGFEIAESAVLSDGVQVAELVGAELVFSFNGREIDTGRFHPALLELNADGTGRIQNSNNVPTLDPLLEVPFGAEYITDLLFDPGNTTLIVETEPGPGLGGGGGSSGCYIATAAYGSYLEPEVKLLRRFRDERLLPHSIGRLFVDWYYRLSPPLAAYIADREWLRAVSRLMLLPLIYGIKYPLGALLLSLLLVMAVVGRRTVR